MLKRFLVLFALVVVIGFTSTRAQANIAFDAMGSPTPTGSWYQGFNLTTDVSYNNLGLVLTPMPGDDGTSGFKPPAWDFSVSPLGSTSASWTNTLNLGNNITVASGVSTNDLFWRSHFWGDMSTQSFVLTAFTFDNYLTTDSIQVAAASWDGSVWDFFTPPSLTWNEFVGRGGTDLGGVVVPVPSSVWLGLIGMAVCIPLVRRF